MTEKTMKKRLLECAFIIIVTTALGWSGLWGQTLAGITPTSGVASQPVTMVLTGSGTNFTTATGCYLRNNTQSTYTIPATTFFASTNNVLTANFLLPPNAIIGSYDICSDGHFQPLLNAFQVAIGPGSSYGLISGKVIRDNNQNCIHDLGDAVYVGKIVTVQPGPYYITTGSQGE